MTVLLTSPMILTGMVHDVVSRPDPCVIQT
jgi:hypothetical protein